MGSIGYVAMASSRMSSFELPLLIEALHGIIPLELRPTNPPSSPTEYLAQLVLAAAASVCLERGDANTANTLSNIEVRRTTADMWTITSVETTSGNAIVIDRGFFGSVG